MTASARPRSFFALALVSLLAACAPQNQKGTPENTTPAKDALEDAKHPGIEACAKGDVEATLQIARDFRESAHEMVVCGGLSAAFVTTAIEVLLRAAAGGSTKADGFAYQGKGVYTAGERMEIKATLGVDTSFGKAGEPIAWDLFDLATWVVDAKLVAKASVDTSGKSKSELHVEVTEKGPAFELLGITPDANGKLDVDFDVIAKSLGSKIILEQRIVMLDAQGGTTVKYELHAPPKPLGHTYDGGSMAMDLVSVTAQAKTGQSITMKTWAMEYAQAGSSGTLDGHYAFEVTGGAFGYVATFDYPHRKEPDVALSCAGQ